MLVYLIRRHINPKLTFEFDNETSTTKNKSSLHFAASRNGRAIQARVGIPFN